jgi:hypothetical protein
MLWINATTGLPVPDVRPVIQYLSAERLHYMVAPDTEYDPDGSFIYHAAYRNDFVYLTKGWDRNDIVDLSTLVHELTHHMQEHSGQTWGCNAAKEPQAYSVQEDFLTAAGVEKPLEAMQVNRLFIAFRGMCGPMR